MDDEQYLRKLLKALLHKELNLDNPQSFNEKIQWLKLHDRNPEYHIMVDKLLAKGYVESVIGNKYIIPTLGMWDKFEEINFESLPEQFVLKTTHDSGGVVVCRSKKDFDKFKARKKINKSLNRSFIVYSGNGLMRM